MRRKLKYGNQDWFSALNSEVRPSASVPVYQQTVYPQAAPCPPGYRYRPKRKPGQRKCTKEKFKSRFRTTLSMLQSLAVQNRISIFKIRKDKKGYTRTLLTIPQLKSRLTKNKVSYKFINSKFGIAPLLALSLASTLASSPIGSVAKSVANKALEKAKKRAKEYINLGDNVDKSKFGIAPLLALSLASTLASSPIGSVAKSVANKALEKAKKRAKEYINLGDNVDKSKFGMEQQNPPWRDSQEPPFYGMSEADYNEVQAMIRSRPERRLQPRPQLTPEQIAQRAESWEARAEELDARSESSDGYSTNQNGRRVTLPSWREILETRRRARIREAVMNSSSRGAGAAFGVLQPRRNISSRIIRRDSEDVLNEMENLRRRRGRDLMRRQIAGDIIFPERPWHGAAPPYATTIQRYARGMLGRNINPNRFGVLPGREQGPDEPEDSRIAYEIEKKRKDAERNRKWRAAQSEANSEKLEAVREAQMDRAAADAIRYLGMTPKERTLAKARERRELGKRAKEFLALQGAGSSSGGAGSSSDPSSGLDFRVLEPDFGKTRYSQNSYGTQEVWQ